MALKIPNLGVMSFLGRPAVPYILMGALSLLTGTYFFGKTVGVQTCQGKLLKAEAELSEARAAEAQKRAVNELGNAVAATNELNRIEVLNESLLKELGDGGSCILDADTLRLLNTYSKESGDISD